MIVNIEDVENTLDIIDLEWEIFGNVSQKFKKEFHAKKRFDLATVLVFLIRNNIHQRSKLNISLDDYYLKLHQRLFGYFIIFDIYSDKGIGDNPFLPFFIAMTELNPVGNKSIPLQRQIEGYFCLNLLFSFQAETLLISSPEMFISSFLFRKPSTYKLPNVKKISKLVLDRLPFTARPLQWLGVSPIIKLNINSNEKKSYDQKQKHREINLKAELTTKNFKPIFTKKNPLIFPVQQNELKWLFVKQPIYLKWIETRDHLFNVEIINLTTISLKEIFNEIEKNDTSIKNINSKTLEKIVKTNYKVVIEYLIILIKMPKTKKFYEVFSNLNLCDYTICLQSIQVVSQFLKVLVLQKEFLHILLENYIQNFILNPKYCLETFLIKIMCVFLKTLIRTIIKHNSIIFHGIQKFCITFSNSKESLGLLKMLKKTNDSFV